MATKKNPEYWYMIVMTNDGPRFITDYSWSDKTAHWYKDKPPVQLDKGWIRDMFVGLTWNGHTCYPVCSPIELDRQPYRYNLGHFEWVSKDKQQTLEEVVAWISEHDGVFEDFKKKFPALVEEESDDK